MKRTYRDRSLLKEEGIDTSSSDDLVFGGDMAFFDRAVTRIPKQFVGVLSGKPGSSKSTLLSQCAISIANNRSTLILLSEEAVPRAEERLERLIGNLSATKQKRIKSRIKFEQCPDVSVAQDLLVREIGNRRNGNLLDFVILDSIHGTGLSSNSLKSYKKATDLFHFCRTIGIPLFAIGHCGRDGSPLGNSVLFHDVDLAAQIHILGGKSRMLAVQKNRQGQIMAPIPLIVEEGTGRLIENPHTEPMSSIAKSILPGSEIVEVQANIRLPKNPSDQGKVCAPGLPRNRVALALECLQQVPELEMDLSNFAVSLTVPGDNIYSRTLGLPLVISVANSYMRRATPENHFFIGELDIQNRCRASDERVLSSIENLIQMEILPKGSTVVVPSEDARSLGKGRGGVSIVGAATLKDCLALIEPKTKGYQRSKPVPKPTAKKTWRSQRRAGSSRTSHPRRTTRKTG